MAGLADYHVHAIGHGEGAFTLVHLESFAARARQTGLEEIGLAEHDEFAPLISLHLLRQARQSFSPVKLRLGLEVSYRPGRERQIEELATRLPFDYLIGSVHDIDGWPFDHPDYVEAYAGWETDELYRRYFTAVRQAATSGLFDVIGHLDLIKVFGYRSRQPVVNLAEKALEAVKAGGLVVEINTAGLFKPVGEIYPSRELLAGCFARDIPITFGSDAHRPEEVGRSFAIALELAKGVGYRFYVRFYRRRRTLVPL